MINQFAYCPRRFWLMFVQGEMEINDVVLEGIIQHQRVHTPEIRFERGKLRYRRLYLWSEELRIRGFADLVEEENGVLVPVEYKRGRQGRWRNDHLQVCAQAMCLEERTGCAVPRGYVFYQASRRRIEVRCDTSLRQEVRQILDAMRRLIKASQAPFPEQPYAKCRGCSLEPICLPREIKRLQ